MNDKTFVDKCIRNDKGEITVFQKPNLPILVWVMATIITKFSHGSIQNFFSIIAFGSLFTWGWLELFSGANYLRKILGLLILCLAVYGRLKG